MNVQDCCQNSFITMNTHPHTQTDTPTLWTLWTKGGRDDTPDIRNTSPALILCTIMHIWVSTLHLNFNNNNNNKKNYNNNRQNLYVKKYQVKNSVWTGFLTQYLDIKKQNQKKISKKTKKRTKPKLKRNNENFKPKKLWYEGPKFQDRSLLYTEKKNEIRNPPLTL